jgi:hypothetical protein
MRVERLEIVVKKGNAMSTAIVAGCSGLLEHRSSYVSDRAKPFLHIY